MICIFHVFLNMFGSLPQFRVTTNSSDSGKLKSQLDDPLFVALCSSYLKEEKTNLYSLV